jgi:hypothetical protein
MPPLSGDEIAMPALMLPEPLVRMTQFYRARNEDLQFHGSCGQTALAVCLANAAGAPADFEGVGELMIHLTKQMIAKGLAGGNGRSTLAALAAQARASDGIVALALAYRDPQLERWRDLLRERAGRQPIVLQVAHGEALVDDETGCGDEQGLRYHAIAIVGQDEGGYLAVDGDHPEVTRRFQHYPEATLAAADPCGLLVLAAQR